MPDCFVVTGGAGFIGSHIAEHLLKTGQRVRIIDDLSTGRMENIAHLSGDLQFHQVSITDETALPDLFAGADYVLHYAALASVPRSIENPQETHAVNATGTLNVLKAAQMAGVRRVIYAASSAVYGDTETDAASELLPPQPISPYGAAKVAGEYYCQVFTHAYGLETVCLRYFNVFGPRQDPTSEYAAVIPIFINALLKGQQPVIFGDGWQSRDFTYIDNVVHGSLLALTAPEAAGQVMNLATGRRITLRQLVDKINLVLESDISPLFAPPRSGDILHSCANIHRARDLLHYAPVVDFDTGLARTIAWYKSRR